MFRFTTGSEEWIRRVYRSRLLQRLVTFDLTRLDEVESDEVREQILAHAGTEGNHGKTTYKGRFRDIDGITERYLRTAPCRVVHDVAVSSGVTSCELYDRLTQAGSNVELHVSDKYNVYYVDGGLVRRVFDAEHEILHGSVLGVVADRRQPFPFIGSRLLFEALRLDVRLRPRVESRTRTVDLFDPWAKRYVREGKLKVLRYDPFVGGERDRFGYVRCMNLLNRGLWFSDEHLVRGVGNLVASLREGAVLQIGRTNDSTRRNHVTFFRKTAAGRLVVLEHYNSGTEVLDILRAAGTVEG